MTTIGKVIIVTKYYCVCNINIYYMYSTKKEEGVVSYVGVMFLHITNIEVVKIRS